MSRLVTTAIILLAAIILLRFWPRVLARLRRFDAANVARIRQEQADRADQLAHFRHTIGTAEEQVEDVSEITELDPRTASPVTRYVFEGERFATRWEAEKVRAQKIGDIARGFYRELPAALAHRGKDRLH
ncbi:MAG TPA: hypothetical protein VF410_06310 [Rhizomicrobium sp.]|mgnify:FL=1|jgi:hypothetical protein